ncbi:MAG: hypothetical protein EOO61_07195, partial [Hymenobacter sp.]
MSYPVGTLIGGPLTNGSEQAKFGTHIDYIGVGGYRTVTTLALRDSIPVKAGLEFDGASTGMRRPGMLVHVLEDGKTYRLDIPGYLHLSDVDKFKALVSNNYWLEVEFGIGTTGDAIQTFAYDPASYELNLVTNNGSFSVDLSSLDVTPTGTSITTVGLDQNYNLVINLSDGSQRSVSLATLAADTKMTAVNLVGNNLNFTFSDTSVLVVDISTLQPNLSGYATKTYVDGAVATVAAGVKTQSDRIDTLVNGAPAALDTLKEIADQIAADEAGAAAILATQQQHTQQLTNVVHLTGAESVAGSKTFTDKLAIGAPNLDAQLTVVAPLTTTPAFVIRGSGSQQADYMRVSRPGIGDLVVIDKDGKMSIGGSSPAERLDVAGNVRAYKFIGDGSLLTGIPRPTLEQNLSSNSTTSIPSVKAVSDAITSVNGQLTNLVHRSGDEQISGNKYFLNNVAIGKNTTTSALDVVGTVKATYFSGDGSKLTNLPGQLSQGQLNNIISLTAPVVELGNYISYQTGDDAFTSNGALLSNGGSGSARFRLNQNTELNDGDYQFNGFTLFGETHSLDINNGNKLYLNDDSYLYDIIFHGKVAMNEGTLNVFNRSQIDDFLCVPFQGSTVTVNLYNTSYVQDVQGTGAVFNLFDS